MEAEWGVRTAESLREGCLLCAPQSTRGSWVGKGLPLGETWSGSILKAELQDFLKGWVWRASGRGGTDECRFFWPRKATRVQLTSSEVGSGCGEQGRGSRGLGSDRPALDVTSPTLDVTSRNDFRHPRGDAKEAVGFTGQELKGQFQAASEKGWQLRSSPLMRKDSINLASGKDSHSWPLKAAGVGVNSTRANGHQLSMLLSGPFFTGQRV